MRFRIAAFGLILLAAFVQGDGRYRDIFIGNKASGLGGAFIGVADDCNAPWYNPAGMVNIEGSSIGTSPSFEAHANGRTGSFLGADEGEFSVMFVPTALGSVSDIGDGKLGLGVFMPVKASFSQTTTADDVTVGLDTWDGFLDRAANEEIFYMGGAYAYPVNESFSLGAACYYVSAQYTHNLYQLILDNAAPNSDYVETEIKETAKQTGFCVALSTMYKFNDNLQLGAALWSQTIMRGTGLYREIGTTVGTAVPGLVSSRDLQLNTGSAKRVIPGNLGIGIAWQINPNWLMAVDVISYFGSTYREYDQTLVRLKPIVNYSFGFEYRITEMVPLRFGFYSNKSYTPAITSADEAQNAHVDVGGIVIGCGYEGKQNRFYGGLKIGSGAGQDKVLDLTTGSYTTVDAYSYNIGIHLGMNYNF